MSLVYDEAFYKYVYNHTMPDGRILYYSREYLNLEDPPYYRRQMKALAPFVGPLTTSPNPPQILIVGCGFSPLLGLQGVTGTDPSTYIQEYKATEVDSPEKLYPYAVPDDIPESWHEGFDFVISDDVLSSLEGYPLIGKPRQSEAEQFIDGCSDMARISVIHFVTTGPYQANWGNPLFTYKPLDEWAKFEPNHTWIDAGTNEVISG